ncbi:hypothetical protein [Candidatus Borrarchaeum sp.]|uniref:hypothetical protein n=1 Tax=Candidatus Borrarchaeum sp. TaxID=2846742 RepID=UPI00257D6296|nr:hypothetical protein [Candidatus Borrarchaeum sp.]
MSADELIEKLWTVSTINTVLINLLLNKEVNETLDERYWQIVKKMLDGSKKQMGKALSGPVDSFIESAITLTNKTLSQIDTLLEKLQHAKVEVEKEEQFLFDDEGLFQLEEEVKKRQKIEAVASSTPELPPQETPTQLIEEVEVEEVKEEEKPMFARQNDAIDEWDYLEHLNRLFETYRQNSHMLLPAFWHAATQELLSYEARDEDHKFAIQTPAETIYRLIRTFLSEAPFARLMQDMKQKHGESELTSSYLDAIKAKVDEYYIRVEEDLTNEIESSKIIIKAEHELETFNMGAASLEKRVLKYIRDVCNNLLTQAKTLSHRNELESIVYAEATILLSRLNGAMIESPPLEFLLKAMKP